ncbi:MAG: beta strand repeat-containing protein [Flavobacteriales bacterium]
MVTISTNGPTTFCQGGSVGLTASNGVSYLWSSGQTTASITAATSGAYSVTVNGANGCSGVSPITQINVLSPNSVSPIVGANSVCVNSATLFSSQTSNGVWSSSNPSIASISSAGMITGVSSGTATISYSIVSTNGCPNSVSKTINVNPTPSTIVSANGQLSFCQGGNVNLTASAGSTYLWSNGATSQTIQVNAAGSYTVTVTSANGCSATSSPQLVNVFQNPIAQIATNGSTTVCSGTIVNLMATPNASYLWSNNATTSSIAVSSSGTYSVTVTNTAGCSMTSTPVVVTVNATPTATISASGPTTICNGAGVLLNSGIAAGQTYQWSLNGTAIPNATNATYNATISGAYSVQISNSSTCTAVSNMINVVVNSTPVATISSSGANTFCQGGNVILTSSSGSSYLWSNGATSQSIVVNSTGNYSVIVSNSNGCNTTSTVLPVVVQSAPLASISANGPTTFCSGSSVVLTAAGGVNYIWNNGSTASSINVSNSGTYSVTATNANGCSAVSNPIILVVNTPSVATISPSGSTTFCQGGTVNLTASQATSYLWTNGATTQSIAVNTAGNYGVTLTNAQGCISNSTSISVVVNSIPTASISTNGPTTFCQGGSVQLTASPGATYLWSNGATGSTIQVSSAGTYNVQISSNTGCSSNATPIVVTVNTAPVATISSSGPLSFCQGGSVLLTASNGANYLWSNNATTQSITVSSSGTYFVQVSNSNSCIATSTSVNVIVNPNSTPIVTSNGSTSICQGGSVFLSTTIVPGATYQWKKDGVNIPAATGYNYSATSAGIYSVQVINASGCSSTSVGTNVTVNSLPSVTISNSGNPTICSGSSVNLTASGGVTYVWSNGSTNSSIPVSLSGTYSVQATNASGCTNTTSYTLNVITPTQASVSASGSTSFCTGQNVVLTANPGVAYLWNNGATTASITVSNSMTASVQVTYANGCSSTSASLPITVNAIAPAVITANGPTSFCQGSNVVLSASSGATYLWNTGATTSSITASTAGSYNVLVTNTNGCSTSSQTVNVQVNANPTATITANGSTSLCQGSSVNLSASSGSSYVWNTGETSATITVNTGGNYFVTVYSSNGCSAVSTITPVSVSIAPVATIQVQGPTTVCQGTNVLLSTSGGANYSWTNGQTTASISVSNSGSYGVTVSNAQGCATTVAPVSIVVNANPSVSSIAGTNAICVGSTTAFTNNTPNGAWTSDNANIASVNNAGQVSGLGSGTTNIHYTVTNSNGCSTSVSKPITVNSLPSALISASGATNFCQGGSVTLTAPAGQSYVWTNNATSQSITVSTSGTYGVQVSNGAGCSVNSSSLNVTVNPLPSSTITSSSTSLCIGSNMVLSASNTGANYVWNTGASSQSIIINNGGNYSVVVTDANGCTATASTLITNVAPPQASISVSGPLTFCQGGSVQLTGAGGASYVWNNGATSQSLNVTTSGVYSVMTTNANGCVGYSNPITVNVQQAPNATIAAYGPTSFCQGGSVTIASSGGGSYLWSTNATTQSVNATTSGAYQLVITGSNGCSATSNVINVNVVSIPTATITPSGATTFCQGGSVNLVASGGSTYSWNNGATTSTITATSGGTYIVTVSNGACSNTASQIVTVNENPSTLIVTSGLTSFCQGGQVTLTAQPGNTYLWSTNETTQSISINNTGSYSVSLLNGNGCPSVSNVIDVIVNQPTSNTISATAFDSYTLNGILYTQSGTYTQTLTNAAGCDSTITLNLTLTVGIEEGTMTDVSVYPNPTSESFTIKTSVPVYGSYEVVDAQGKLVFMGQMTGNETHVNISSVARGVYYLRIPELSEPLRVVKN